MTIREKHRKNQIKRSDSMTIKEKLRLMDAMKAANAERVRVFLEAKKEDVKHGA